MTLDDGDTILTAYAESARGPGWSNTPIWVIVRARTGRLRQDCIQPAEQTRDMELLCSISECVNTKMVAAVRSIRQRRSANVKT